MLTNFDAVFAAVPDAPTKHQADAASERTPTAPVRVDVLASMEHRITYLRRKLEDLKAKQARRAAAGSLRAWDERAVWMCDAALVEAIAVRDSVSRLYYADLAFDRTLFDSARPNFSQIQHAREERTRAIEAFGAA